MRITLICCLLLLTFTLAHAQESTPEPIDGWTIEQRCVAEPTTPPDDGSFDGTIFLQDNDGIHALRADVETPYYVAFAGRDFITAGAVSPDGTMFAVPSGDVEYGNMVADVYIVREIRIYSTEPSNELLFIFPIYYSEYSDAEETGVSDVIWLDNERIVYYGTKDWDEIESSTDFYIFNLLNNEITPRVVTTTIDPLFALTSPDGTRAISSQRVDNTIVSRTLYDVETGEVVAELPISPYAYIWWHPDSSLFIADFESENPQPSIYDRDGNFVETIYRGRIHSISWSVDGQRFVFVSNSNIYVVDMQAKQVTDICVSIPYGTVWFLDNTQVVFNYNDSREIVILNLTDWLAYTIAYHRGQIIGWRDDD